MYIRRARFTLLSRIPELGARRLRNTSRERYRLPEHTLITMVNTNATRGARERARIRV